MNRFEEISTLALRNNYKTNEVNPSILWKKSEKNFSKIVESLMKETTRYEGQKNYHEREK